MTNLDVFRLSAEGCGKKLPEDAEEHANGLSYYDAEGTYRTWYPFTNAEQDRECEEELLKRCCSIYIAHNGESRIWHSERWPLAYECPPRELRARALAELVRREKEKK